MALLIAAIRVYSVIIIAQVVLSWVPVEHRPHELYLFLLKLTEPVLRPIRQVLPSAGGLDFSPLIVLILLGVIASALARL
jgi:YggT family protein